MWHITNQKFGANALGLQRALNLGSYHTAWEWLHKLRRAMVRPGRDRLGGLVEMDETYVGGKRKPGKRGRGAAGKALVGIAVEDKGKGGIGRIRLQHLTDASGASLIAFAQSVVRPGTTIRTDNWKGTGSYLTPAFRASSSRHATFSSRTLLPRCSSIGCWEPTTVLFGRRTCLTTSMSSLSISTATSASRGKVFYRLVQQVMMVDPLPGASLVGPAVGFVVETSVPDLDAEDNSSNHNM